MTRPLHLVPAGPGHRAGLQLHVGAAFYHDRYRRTDDGWKICATGYDRTYDATMTLEGLNFKLNPVPRSISGRYLAQQHRAPGRSHCMIFTSVASSIDTARSGAAVGVHEERAAAAWAPGLVDPTTACLYCGICRFSVPLLGSVLKGTGLSCTPAWWPSGSSCRRRPTSGPGPPERVLRKSAARIRRGAEREVEREDPIGVAHLGRRGSRAPCRWRRCARGIPTPTGCQPAGPRCHTSILALIHLCRLTEMTWSRYRPTGRTTWSIMCAARELTRARPQHTAQSAVDAPVHRRRAGYRWDVKVQTRSGRGPRRRTHAATFGYEPSTDRSAPHVDREASRRSRSLPALLDNLRPSLHASRRPL